MKRLAFNAFLGTILSFSLACISSGLDEPAIAASKEIFWRSITSKLREMRYDRANSSSISVPYVNVNPSSSLENVPTRFDLQVDSTRGYAIIKNLKRNTIDVIRKQSTKIITTSVVIDESELSRIRMIDFVIERYSKNPFFLSIDDEITEEIVAFFVKDEIHFLNKKMELMTNFEDLINQQIGSIDKYNEQRAVNRTKGDMLKKLSGRLSLVAFLRKDYLTHMNAFPKDTVLIMNKLLNEMETACRISVTQKKLLQQALFDGLSNKRLPFYCGSGTPFYAYDIDNCIKMILTRNQMAEFLAMRELNLWLATKASDRMYLIIYNEGKIPSDQIAKKLNEEIFR